MADDSYHDDDFVYVDPDKKVVVSKVEWDANGKPIPKERVIEEKGDTKGRKRKKRYYPWGSYKTLCKLYSLKGKVKEKETESSIPLPAAIDRLMEEPYWD